MAATILIVDDELQNRKLLEALLRPEGYLTQSASNGEEALAAIARTPPDLVLLDVMMPGMDGYEVARRLKLNHLTSNIPIIMVTAQIDRSARLAGLDAGAEDFLTKPVDRAELWLRVRNLLRLKELGDFFQNHNVILEQQVQARTVDLQRFRTAMDATADAIILLNRNNLRFIEVNAAACAMLGYTREELLQLAPTEIGEETTEQVESRFDALIASPNGNELTETWIRRKDGSSLQVELRCNVHYFGSDWIMVGVLRDITERMAAQQALAESEQRFRQISENVRDVFYLVDAENTRLFYVSPAYEAIWGRSMASLIADPQSWTDAIHPDDRARVLAQFPSSVANGKCEFDYRIHRPDGELRWIHGSGYPVLDSNGVLHRIAGSASDITEMKDAEQKIRRLNRVYAMLSGINSLIVRVNDRDELFRRACCIVVEDGGFLMSWIGMLDPNTTNVVPVASAGMDEATLMQINERLADHEQAKITMLVRAMTEKKFLVSNESQMDSGAVFGKLHAESGVRSLAVFPLVVADQAVGVLALYSGEVEFFHEDELKLLTELAGDISFALDHIGKAEKISYLAYYDQLTGLANATLFRERLAQHLHDMTNDRRNLAVALLDVERFKTVNDALGRPAGDALLKQLATRLVESVDSVDRVAHLGADHFALVLKSIKDPADVARIINEIFSRCFDEPFLVGDTDFQAAARIGIALYPDDGSTPDALLRNAESALKKAKSGGERYLFYSEEMNARVTERLTLENKLRCALERKEFVLHYQPKVSSQTRQIVGVEALIRWNSPETALVPPGEFIPLLEETGLILDVGAWALHQAVADHRRWLALGLPAPRVAVNVSSIQLRQPDFVEVLKRAVGAAPPGIDLEITESLIMDDIEGAISKLGAVRDLGLDIAVDDFGTGYSSLAYLTRLPVGTIKIDRSFVITMVEDPNTMSMVSAIISLAHSLSLKVVAEGVDQEDQAKYLRLLHCNVFQGYLFSKPVPFDEISRLLRQGPLPER